MCVCVCLVTLHRILEGTHRHRVSDGEERRGEEEEEEERGGGGEESVLSLHIGLPPHGLVTFKGVCVCVFWGGI